MNSIRKKISFLIVAIVFLYGCKTQQANSSKDCSCNWICTDYSSEDPFLLEENLIQAMVQKYQNPENQSPADQQLPGGKNTTSIWFDLETLKKFIYQIEHTTQTNDAGVSSEQLGVRVYLTTYPNAEQFSNYEDLQSVDIQTAPNRNTVIMVPTINQKGRNVDFDPMRVSTYQNGLKVGANSQEIEKMLGIEKNKAGSLASLEEEPTPPPGDKTMALNHGTYIPPPYKDSDESFTGGN